jgi:hypothetical protein
MQKGPVSLSHGCLKKMVTLIDNLQTITMISLSSFNALIDNCQYIFKHHNPSSEEV